MLESSRGLKIYAGSVLALLILGTLYSAYRLEAFFPFSTHSMYGHRDQTEKVHRFRSFCILESKSQIAVSDFDLWRAEFLFYFEGLETEDLSVCQDVAQQVLATLPAICRGLELKAFYWEKFTGPRAFSPDIQRSLCVVRRADGGAL